MNWIITSIALLGVVLNIKHKWQGFLCWLVSNAWWFRHNLSIDEYAQASLYAIFFVLSFIGLIYWNLKKVKNNLGFNKRVYIDLEVSLFCRRLIKTFDICKMNGKTSIKWVKAEAERILRLLQND